MKRIFSMSFIAVIFLTFGGCAAARMESVLNSSNVKPGMSKEEVIKVVGKPSRVSFYYNDKNQLVDEQFYIDRVLRMSMWYEVTSRLTYVNDRLVQSDVVDERREREPRSRF
ncbi:hypothetical protein [Sphingobacterium hungaricum]